MELWKRVSDNLQRFTWLNVMRGSKSWLVRILFIKGITRVRYARVLVTSSLHIHILKGFKMYLLIKLSLINSFDFQFQEDFTFIRMNEIKLERAKFSA